MSKKIKPENDLANECILLNSPRIIMQKNFYIWKIKYIKSKQIVLNPMHMMLIEKIKEKTDDIIGSKKSEQKINMRHFIENTQRLKSKLVKIQNEKPIIASNDNQYDPKIYEFFEDLQKITLQKAKNQTILEEIDKQYSKRIKYYEEAKKHFEVSQSDLKVASEKYNILLKQLAEMKSIYQNRIEVFNKVKNSFDNKVGLSDYELKHSSSRENEIISLQEKLSQTRIMVQNSYEKYYLIKHEEKDIMDEISKIDNKIIQEKKLIALIGSEANTHSPESLSTSISETLNKENSFLSKLQFTIFQQEHQISNLDHILEEKKNQLSKLQEKFPKR